MNFMIITTFFSVVMLTGCFLIEESNASINNVEVIGPGGEVILFFFTIFL